eukprot:jgi/Phyca11/510481/fgenesh2_kg.PHYCAscaffold_61_\
MPAAEMASPTSEKDGNESSMSLIQRIGQVTISSGKKNREKEEQEVNEDTDGEENEAKNKTVFKSPLRVRSPNSNTLADLTPQSRKRRAAFGIQYEAGGGRSSSSTGRSVKPLFPTLKKQKLCEVGDGFLQVVTRKSKPTSKSTAEGTTGSPSSGKSGGEHNSTKNLHKRQRESPKGMQDDESPIAEELRVSHVHHRHHAHHLSKRQKSSSTH